MLFYDYTHILKIREFEHRCHKSIFFLYIKLRTPAVISLTTNIV